MPNPGDQPLFQWLWRQLTLSDKIEANSIATLAESAT